MFSNWWKRWLNVKIVLPHRKNYKWQCCVDVCQCELRWADVSLKAMYHAKPIQRKLMVEFIQTDQILALTEIVVNILRGRINIHNIHRERLRNYQRVMRSLVIRHISVAKKKTRTFLAFHDIIPLPVLHWMKCATTDESTNWI